MAFWLTALLLAAIVAAIVVLTLLRGRSGAVPTAAYDLQVYRDQLKEVERDLARGVLTQEDAERTRLEVSRRVLAADRALREGGGGGRAPRAASRLAGLLAAAVIVGGAVLVYSRVGAPGYPDLPLKAREAAADEARLTRPRQAEAESQLTGTPLLPAPDPRHAELVEKLRAVVAERPDDAQGLALLARNEAVLGNFRAAYQAQARLIELKGAEAGAGDYADLADMMVLAAGGYVSPEAEAALEAALTRDPANGAARYYAGLLYAQTGRPDIAFGVWRRLLEESPADAPWVAPIRAQIPELALRAGVDYRLPPLPGDGTRGPTAEDMQNAADMTPEERQAMIEGMVERLATRLAEEGGTAAEWAQLIGALGNLGQTERAAAIWAEAQTVFAGAPADLARIRAAAESAGVAEAAPAPALRGPTAEDMQNAADMTPEERQAMIAGMVERLATRLAEEGGTAAEWAQLIGALGNLGQTERAAATWAEAQTVFAGAPADLARIRAAAAAAGVAE